MPFQGLCRVAAVTGDREGGSSRLCTERHSKRTPTRKASILGHLSTLLSHIPPGLLLQESCTGHWQSGASQHAWQQLCPSLTPLALYSIIGHSNLSNFACHLLCAVQFGACSRGQVLAQSWLPWLLLEQIHR